MPVNGTRHHHRPFLRARLPGERRCGELNEVLPHHRLKLRGHLALADHLVGHAIDLLCETRREPVWVQATRPAEQNIIGHAQMVHRTRALGQDSGAPSRYPHVSSPTRRRMASTLPRRSPTGSHPWARRLRRSRSSTGCAPRACKRRSARNTCAARSWVDRRHTAVHARFLSNGGPRGLIGPAISAAPTRARQHAAKRGEHREPVWGDHPP